ncbi:MAG: DNA double-strand break repair nuclease NurA [Acidobacteria bacterium]|nr:DNA double-strand break repair nuclease NurA [Acidobacteriota bacterium]MBI3421856.1 DNA double-strand break repair nuclease NurA [Acidobacteriota bacterium]
MILRERILEQLTAKKTSLLAFEDEFQQEAETYAAALEQFCQLSLAELESRLSAHECPGALPTPEFGSVPQMCLDFAPQFNHHADARAWASAMLLGHTTVAADGSQILPNDEMSIPVAAVQVAWFSNAHTRAGRYVKDLVFELLPPEDLLIELRGERQFSEQAVSVRRFRLEVKTLCEQMCALAADETQRAQLPLVLFDSSLVISFAEQLHEELGQQYISAVLELLRCSEQTRVPVVGYVDSSRAHDLTKLLSICFNLREAERVHDAQLLSARMNWGARSPFFICARGSSRSNQPSVLEGFAEYRRGIGFVYLKTNAQAPPARLEIPRWVYEQGLLDEVVDLVRAEVIVGNGYPYALETADAAAVLSGSDREAFYRIFQRFAEEQGIKLRISPKAASKARRR